jgi:hypothetical protein
MLLSGRLVRLIQDHSEGQAEGLAARVHNHPDLPALAKRSTAELRHWCAHQITYLNSSIAAQGEDVRGRYQTLGRERFEQSIPLHEAVLRFFLLKDMIIEFAHTQGLPMTALDLYAQEELEQRICRFFDAAVYNVVCGYEEAMRQPGHIHA